MKRWIVIAFLTFAWLHDGLEGMRWKNRAMAAEERAERAEAWAQAVEDEAELWVNAECRMQNAQLEERAR